MLLRLELWRGSYLSRDDEGTDYQGKAAQPLLGGASLENPLSIFLI